MAYNFYFMKVIFLL